MRLTLSVDPRRGGLGVHTDHALDYSGAHVAQVVAAAVSRAVDQLLGGGGIAGRVPAQRPDPDDQLLPHPDDDAGEDPPGQCDDEATHCRVLRLLDQGHTVAAVAERLGVDPELIDRWDDDATIDARTDLLAAGLTGLAPIPTSIEGRWQ